MTVPNRLCILLGMGRKNPHAVALGRKGGIASGKVRKERIPADVRSAIARKAVLARWAKAKRGDTPQGSGEN